MSHRLSDFIRGGVAALVPRRQWLAIRGPCIRELTPLFLRDTLFDLVADNVRPRRLRNFTEKIEPAQPKWFFCIIIMTLTQAAE